MLEKIAEILFLIGTSMVKFAMTAPFVYQFEYSYLETVLITAIGGVAGVYVFYYSAGWLMQRAFKRKLKRAMENKKVRKTFSRKNKIIVRIKRGSGLQGLALITPPLLGIPIGSIIAAKYFYGQRRTLPLLVTSTVVWAFVLSFFWRFTA